MKLAITLLLALCLIGQMFIIIDHAELQSHEEYMWNHQMKIDTETNKSITDITSAIDHHTSSIIMLNHAVVMLHEERR